MYSKKLPRNTAAWGLLLVLAGAPARAADAPPTEQRAMLDLLLRAREEVPTLAKNRFQDEFCGPAEPYPEEPTTGCEKAQVVLRANGALTYDAQRTAGSFCLEKPPGSLDSPLVSIGTAGPGGSVRCGVVRWEHTYRGVGDSQAPFASLRVAFLSKDEAAGAKAEARQKAQVSVEDFVPLEQQLRKADEVGEDIRPILARQFKLPMAKIPTARLVFAGQIPLQSGLARPLYVLDAAAGWRGRPAAMFDTQRPLFFVYNLRSGDRVYLIKGKELNDSAIPLKVIELAKTAVSGASSLPLTLDLRALAKRNNMSALYTIPEVPEQVPGGDLRKAELYQRGAATCSLDDLCSGVPTDSCRATPACSLLNPEAARVLCRLITLIPPPSPQQPLPPLLAHAIKAEIASVFKEYATPGKTNDPKDVVRTQLHRNVQALAALTEDQLHVTLHEGLVSRSSVQPGQWTAQVLAGLPMEGGFEYHLKVFHADEHKAAGKPTDDEDPAPKDAVKPEAGGAYAARPFEVRSHRPYVSTATEMSLDFPVWPSATPAGGYAFQRVSGGGSDPLFQLLPLRGPENQVSFAQLLTVYPFARSERRWLEGLGLAAGPTFIRADGAGAFKQLNLRVLWEPPITRGVLVSVGPSLRFVDVPLHYPENALIAQAAAPEFAKASRPMVLFSIGLTIDEGVVGTVVAGKLAEFKKTPKKQGAAP